MRNSKDGVNSGPMFSNKNTKENVQEADSKWHDII